MSERAPERASNKPSSKPAEKSNAVNKVRSESRPQLVQLNKEARQRLDTARQEKQKAAQKAQADTFRVNYFQKLASGASDPTEKAKYQKLAERSKAIQSESRALSNDARRTEAAVVSKLNQLQKTTNDADAQRKMAAIRNYTNGQADKFQNSINRARYKSNVMRDGYLTQAQSQELQTKEYAKLDKTTKDQMKTESATVKQEGFNELTKNVGKHTQALETNTLSKETAIQEFYGNKATVTVDNKTYSVDTDFGQLLDANGNIVRDQNVISKVQETFEANVLKANLEKDEVHRRWMESTANIPEDILSKGEREKAQKLMFAIANPLLSDQERAERKKEYSAYTRNLILNASKQLTYRYESESLEAEHERNVIGSQIAVDVLSSIIPIGPLANMVGKGGAMVLNKVGRPTLQLIVEKGLPAVARTPEIISSVVKAIASKVPPRPEIINALKETPMGALLDSIFRGTAYVAKGGLKVAQPVLKRGGEMLNSTGRALKQAKRTGGVILRNTGEATAKVAGKVKDKAGDVAGTVVDTSKELGTKVANKTKEIASQARAGTELVADNVKSAAGAAKEKVVETSGKVVAKGKEVGQSVKAGVERTTDSVKNTAGVAKQKVIETSGKVADKSKEVAQNIKVGTQLASDTVKETASAAKQKVGDTAAKTAEKTKEVYTKITTPSQEATEWALKQTKERWNEALGKTVEKLKGSDMLTEFQQKFGTRSREYVSQFTQEFSKQYAELAQKTGAAETAKAMQKNYTKALSNYLQKMNDPKIVPLTTDKSAIKTLTNAILKDFAA